MTKRTRDPVRDAKIVVEKAIADLTTTDVLFYLGRDHVDAENILDIIEAATINLRWNG